jgi:hypothetical protein
MSRKTLQLISVLIALTVGGCTTPVAQAPLTEREALALLTSQQFDALDRHFSAVQRGYRTGAISEEGLRAAFRVFYATDPALEPKYNLWVESFPRSYVAHLARGIHYKKVGLERRGPQPFSQTTDEQLRGMRENFRKASQDFQYSYSLDDKPLLSYMHAVNISTVTGDREEGRRLLDLAIKVDPRNVIVRAAYMDTLRLRWGGEAWMS